MCGQFIITKSDSLIVIYVEKCTSTILVVGISRSSTGYVVTSQRITSEIQPTSGYGSGIVDVSLI